MAKGGKQLRPVSPVFGGIAGATGVLLLLWAVVHELAFEHDLINLGFKYAIGLVGSLALLLGIALVRSNALARKGWILSLVTLCFFYLFAEFTSYLLRLTGVTNVRRQTQDGSFGLFNGACAEYDSISGYRWLQKDCRVFKMVNREVVFDQRFSGNNMGYISVKNYTYQKPDERTRRYLVFGDSFTAAEFLQQAFPDRAEALLNARIDTSKQKFQLYSFAVDGGGLFNWHRIFKHDILPNYEFDGIILALWGDDIDRNFFIMHHTDSIAYGQYFTQIPRSLPDLEQNYLPKMWHAAEIVSDADLDARLEKLRQSKLNFAAPDLYFLMQCYDAFGHFRYLRRKKYYEQQHFSERKADLKYFDKAEFIVRHGKERWQKLHFMLDYCRQNDKEIIVAALPYLPSIRKGELNMAQTEAAFIANYFDGQYFDGFDAYADFSNEELQNCFLKYDIHWNQQGSDIFAELLVKFMLSQPKEGKKQ